MDLLDIGTRLEEQNSTLYLGIGVLSVAKAGLLGRIGRPVDRELRDAALFLGAGLFLRSFQQRRKARTEPASESGSTADTERTESTQRADDAGTDDPADVRTPTADETVVVTGTGADEETERDRGRSAIPDVVTDAVNRISGA